jgi:hypothetical protein
MSWNGYLRRGLNPRLDTGKNQALPFFPPCCIESAFDILQMEIICPPLLDILGYYLDLSASFSPHS